MSANDDKIANKIEKAKKELEKLKKQLREKRDAMNDTTLEKVCEDIEGVGNLKAGELKVRLRRTMAGHLSKVYALSWSGDGIHVVSASQDGKILEWEATTGQKTSVIHLRSVWVMTCDYAETGSYVAAGGLDNLVSIYNMRSTEQPRPLLKELGGHAGYISSVGFVDDNQILSASGDMTIRLWDLNSAKTTIEFSGHQSDIMIVEPSNDGRTFLTGACDETTKLWDIRTKKSVQTFHGHESDVNSVRFFPNYRSFGTGSDDSSCRLFDIRADRELACYLDESIICGITSIDFSASGRFLFAGQDDQKISVWDVLKVQNVCSLKGHDNRVTALRMNPQGQCLCSTSWDSVLKIWC